MNLPNDLTPTSKSKAPNGYIHLYCPGYPSSGGKVPEHRFVIEQSIGRFLKRGEVVHHINGQRDDNRLENLQLCLTNREHYQIHKPPKKCETCGECHNPGGQAMAHCSKCNKVIRLSGRNHMPPVCWECKFPTAKRNRECACSKCGKELRGDGRRVWPALCQDCMYPDSKCGVCGLGTKGTGGGLGFCGTHYASWRRWSKRGMTRETFVAKFLAFEAQK